MCSTILIQLGISIMRQHLAACSTVHCGSPEASYRWRSRQAYSLKWSKLPGGFQFLEGNRLLHDVDIERFMYRFKTTIRRGLQKTFQHWVDFVVPQQFPRHLRTLTEVSASRWARGQLHMGSTPSDSISLEPPIVCSLPVLNLPLGNQK